MSGCYYCFKINNSIGQKKMGLLKGGRDERNSTYHKVFGNEEINNKRDNNNNNCDARSIYNI